MLNDTLIDQKSEISSLKKEIKSIKKESKDTNDFEIMSIKKESKDTNDFEIKQLKDQVFDSFTTDHRRSQHMHTKSDEISVTGFCLKSPGFEKRQDIYEEKKMIIREETENDEENVI